MAVRIIDNEDGAVLYCSTEMRAFGPVFDDVEQAEGFLAWLGDEDPRRLSQAYLDTRHDHWHKATHNAAGEYIGWEATV